MAAESVWCRDVSRQGFLSSVGWHQPRQSDGWVHDGLRFHTGDSGHAWYACADGHEGQPGQLGCGNCVQLRLHGSECGWCAMEETPTLIGLMRMAREPDVRRGLAFMLAMAGALGRQHAHALLGHGAVDLAHEDRKS